MHKSNLCEEDVIEMLRLQKEMFRHEGGYIRSNIIKKYAKKFSNEVARNIQLNGDVQDCCDLWANGGGNPPLEYLLITDS